MKTQLAGDLMTALSRLPNDHSARFVKERVDEDEAEEEDGSRWLLVAYVYKNPPEDGWPSRGAYFNHPLEWTDSHSTPCPEQWAYDDSLVLAVSASLDKPEKVERLLISAINERWGNA